MTKRFHVSETNTANRSGSFLYFMGGIIVMKKMFFVVLSILIFFIVTGCGGNEKKAESKTAKPETAKQVQVNAGAEAKGKNAGNTEKRTGKEWGRLTGIKIQIEDRTYQAYLYDNAAGKYMASQLPYKIHLDKGEIDYCGTCGLEFENKGFDSQEGHVKGEILYFNRWFVIFLNEKLPLGESGPRIPFGRLANPDDADDMLKHAASSSDVLFTVSEKNAQ